jgi:P2-related tail formation protein
MITKFNLYPQDRTRKPMEDVVEQMRRSIQVEQRELSGRPRQARFRVQISISYENRIVAQKVAADLVGHVHHRHQRERTNASMQTTQSEDHWKPRKKN